MIIIMVSACSRMELAVNFANVYITSKADDYFDLTRDQASWMRAAIKKDIEVVKKTIFPQLATELNRTAEFVRDTQVFEAGMVETTYLRLKNLFLYSMKIFIPTAKELVNKLSLTQVESFKKEFAAKNTEIKEGDSKKAYKKIKEHFDTWLGGMTALQKKELEDFFKTNPPVINEKIANREKLANGFVKYFPDPKLRSQYIENLFTSYEPMRDPSFVKASNEYAKKFYAFVANILNKMPVSQKAILVDTLKDRAQQIEKMIP